MNEISWNCRDCDEKYLIIIVLNCFLQTESGFTSFYSFFLPIKKNSIITIALTFTIATGSSYLDNFLNPFSIFLLSSWISFFRRIHSNLREKFNDKTTETEVTALTIVVTSSRFMSIRREVLFALRKRYSYTAHNFTIIHKNTKCKEKTVKTTNE